MTGKEKKSIYEAVEGRYSDPTYANEASILTREVIKISEEWLAQSKITPKTTRREARKDLKIYVMSQINLNDYKKSYFLPSFIWVFIATQIISYIIKMIIERHTRAR